jgi:hypothetical protein
MNSRTRLATLLATLLTCLPLALGQEDSRRGQQVQNYGNLPLSFEANWGQTDSQVRFLSRGNGYSLFLTDSAAVLALNKRAKRNQIMGYVKSQSTTVKTGKTDVIRMELAGANHAMRVAGVNKLTGTANYFIGNDPARWHSGVETYGKVKYTGVYPGVDLVYYGNQAQLEYDFVVAPGASPEPIRLHFAGTEKLSMSPRGDLKVMARNGEMALKKPVVYQDSNGLRKYIDGQFKLLASNSVKFALGNYDHCLPLIVDPVLTYATYLGGDLSDYASAIAVDASGYAYVAGVATSSDFPVTTGAFQTENGNSENIKSNAFVSKLDPTGSSLIYSTYLGGTSAVQGDNAMALALDGSGNVYLAGIAWSSDFPITKGAFQTQKLAPDSEPSAFVTKLNSIGGALIYSTFLGGNGGDYSEGKNGKNYYGDGATSLAVDSTGNAYITGYASSPDFPVTSGALQIKNAAAAQQTFNAFITKLNPAGSAEVYSTYLGGSGDRESGDLASSLALDSSGNAYVTGFATSADFPLTKGAFQVTNSGFPSSTNAFVSKLNSSGSALVFSTFLGGCCGDQANAIAVDSSGNSYVTGQTTSSDFPITTGAFQTTYNAQGDYTGFITKLNQTGTAEIYSTYLGGTDEDSVNSIAIDTSGNAYVVGAASSSDFPITKDAFQKQNNGIVESTVDLGGNAFITELNPAGSALVYSTYLGGGCYYCNAGDYATSVALDGTGNLYLAGYAESVNFPVTKGAFQTVHNQDTTGIPNAFIAKLSVSSPPPIASTPAFSPSAGTYVTAQSITITDSTSGASIYYTTDGSGPTTASTKYSAAIPVSKTETIKAIAAAAGYTNSAIASATYTITPQSAIPVFSPAAGTYASAQSVTITDSTAGAIIHYTTNGTTPTTSSAKYTGAITVSATETIEAIAVAAGYANSAVASATYTIQPLTTGALQFIPVTPCRIADTRNLTGAFGGPELAAAATRTFDVPQSACGIPTTAVAYSLNVTVVPIASLGYLTIWPAGEAQPVVSTLNSTDGRVKANATITPAGANGGVNVYASDATQFILDIDGYFVPAGTSSSGLEFYPLTPCRIADTRNATGALGGPSLTGGVGRAFPVQSSACGIPSTAKAYSLNITAVPHGSLGFLTTWPTGQTQPVVSTLNATTGAVTANAAIVPAGTSGEISILVSDAADVILDVNGYFAPPVTGGLSLYTVTPCRAIDTRNGAGAFDGLLAVPVHDSSCAPPTTAQAYVLNATVVPAKSLSYLTLWAAGGAQPDVSTLNAIDGAVTSNMAIVPTTNGSINAFSTDSTNLLLDLSSYFAP